SGEPAGQPNWGGGGSTISVDATTSSVDFDGSDGAIPDDGGPLITKPEGGPFTGFPHPRVLVNSDQLPLGKSKGESGAGPWTTAFNEAKRSSYGSLSATPKPRATVECGSYSNPDNGCSEEQHDAIAAYTDALLWYLTGDESYAKKSIEFMNAWSAVLKEHTN